GPLEEVPDLARQPVLTGSGLDEALVAGHRGGVPAGLDRPGAQLHLVGTQPEDEVVEFPAHRQRPERRAQGLHAACVGRRLVAGTWSTRRQACAVRPRTPSLRVATTSARSLRTPRLSTSLVRPPVPGSTASSGTSGIETAVEPSSTRMISSHARASSYPPP